MDAVKFLKNYKRMCEFLMDSCKGCEIFRIKGNKLCRRFIMDNPEETVHIVEKWSAEHPVKTRQSEFLKMFPDAEIKDGYLHICPGKIDKNFKCNNRICSSCLQKFWLAEVE